MADIAQYLGTGKRKTSVARVILRPGDGTTWINGKTLEQYFPRATHRVLATAPLKTAGAEGTYDLRVRVHGGGPSGQAGAIRHGIARALVEADPDLGVVISASHNPPEYNGVKFFDREGRKLSDAAEEEIEALLDAAGPGGGEVDRVEVAVDSYLDHVLERFGSDLSGLKIAVDCANGAYSEI